MCVKIPRGLNILTKQNIPVKKEMIIIDSLAYSLHLGSDRNKRNSARSTAKTNQSGTTSLNNNAIQNARG